MSRNSTSIWSRRPRGSKFAGPITTGCVADVLPFCAVAVGVRAPDFPLPDCALGRPVVFGVGVVALGLVVERAIVDVVALGGDWRFWSLRASCVRGGVLNGSLSCCCLICGSSGARSLPSIQRYSPRGG